MVCVCFSAGTLTAVESFLTVSTGADVCNNITHKSMQWTSLLLTSVVPASDSLPPCSLLFFQRCILYNLFFSLSQMLSSSLVHVCHFIFHLLSLFSPFEWMCLFVILSQGGCIHDGTWQSAIYGFADGQKLQSLRRKFNHKPLPTVGAKIKRRYVGQWVAINPCCQIFNILFPIIGKMKKRHWNISMN